MRHYYLDTSALVKIYRRETGSETMLKLYRSEDKLSISELSKIEFLSTVYRKYRDHEITPETLEVVINKFEDNLEQRYQILKLSSLIVDEAWSLLRQFAETYSLKTLDSIQFAFFRLYPPDVIATKNGSES
ncbi:type II toxin-antitoxin system VapC family toxin [candidate division CSSED10-310 bacterium]|uniref:Type II toxin-antitoxin system VapC family toxin n=1 Tax=candidate division CSSED10-310 bacterium TaxID=2855610 RepID=A0ABV6YUZ0_UNCC1